MWHNNNHPARLSPPLVFAIVDVHCYVINGNKNIRHNSLPRLLLAPHSQRPKTMERQEDALNKLWEQSISYNGTINFTLAEESRRMQVCIFIQTREKTQINKSEASRRRTSYCILTWLGRFGLKVMNLLKKCVMCWYCMIYYFLFYEM